MRLCTKSPLHRDFSVQPLRPLCLCREFWLQISQPQRHRGRRGCTEKSDLLTFRAKPADAVMRAVSTLLAKNESVIKKLRTRQPVISKIDEKLLVEMAGVDVNEAKFLCTDFKRYWRTPSS